MEDAATTMDDGTASQQRGKGPWEQSLSTINTEVSALIFIPNSVDGCGVCVCFMLLSTCECVMHLRLFTVL